MTTTFVTNTEGQEVIDKDPNDVLDYTFDWTAYLAAIADTITGTPTLTLDTGITKNSQTNTTNTVTLIISGGTAINIYRVLCQIQTAACRTIERSFYIRVINR